MAARELAIHLTAGEPRLGMWCDICMTSGRFEMDIFRLTENGVQVIGTARRCTTCRETLPPRSAA